jgi:erythromycin esterase-like protein
MDDGTRRSSGTACLIQHHPPCLPPAAACSRARRPEGPGIVVWAHNSHLGDARATDMGWRRGELNLGQLARQAYPEGEVYNIGFSTYTGGP